MQRLEILKFLLPILRSVMDELFVIRVPIDFTPSIPIPFAIIE